MLQTATSDVCSRTLTFVLFPFRPNLLSLDLSFNNFTDLLGLVSKLATLRKLRVLVLQGNPLALIPGYRGLIIDSLPKLCILDDVSILPDEKNRFYGLSSQPGETLFCKYSSHLYFCQQAARLSGLNMRPGIP